MITEADLSRRARLHHALADETRLALLDALALCDRTPGELRRGLDMTSNLLAFHLDTLERAGLVARHRSQGDARRRYVRLEPAAWPHVAPGPPVDGSPAVVLFVCTHNAARSQLAEALWRARSGGTAQSAGAEPADAVDPTAVAVARAHGLDLGLARPRGYADVNATPDLVVSVCDRVSEAPLPFTAPRLHWSVADPIGGDGATFEAAYADLASRVDRLARVVRAD